MHFMSIFLSVLLCEFVWCFVLLCFFVYLYKHINIAIYNIHIKHYNNYPTLYYHTINTCCFSLKNSFLFFYIQLMCFPPFCFVLCIFFLFFKPKINIAQKSFFKWIQWLKSVLSWFILWESFAEGIAEMKKKIMKT